LIIIKSAAIRSAKIKRNCDIKSKLSKLLKLILKKRKAIRRRKKKDALLLTAVIRRARISALFKFLINFIILLINAFLLSKSLIILINASPRSIKAFLNY
jgi:ABC-type multidrug transport system fused ATPase/permease subunit